MRKKDKTKFPVARIKKIMQMDEEVGKMAQATPILISKSLELFMQSIIDDVAKHARVCNARKISTTHLKRCIENTECYDFLKDIVETVADDGDGGGVEACVAKVAELGSAGGQDAQTPDVLGGGGGGAPLSMILDAPPADRAADLSASGDDVDGDPDYTQRSSASSGRGRGRGGRSRGRPRLVADSS
ncbi:hypothetical protein H4217_008046 [Coemansia sp. RSA 1939]|nr:hypothetical protein H4217_008046 [Coemansia sp. RSA 1939]KAJ2607378.1 hypothetical protein EV177_005551 [Coemansia sp. RSA 1804]KAJ2682654.1 hypothetical protein GGH99_004653 [Coemansia sp. RSA 1285]